MAELIPFPKEAPVNSVSKSLEKWVEHVHELAKKSENVYLHHLHAKERMAQRDVSIQQVFDVLRNGKGVDGPKLDQYGCWRIKMERCTAGRRVQVVLVVDETHVQIITVICKTR